MYQIYDVLTEEHILRKDYDNMVRVEKIAKVKSIDRDKKEIYGLTSQAYGFSKKENIEKLEFITADWKNYLFADENSMDGSLFAIRFAIRGAAGPLTISVATKMFASVLKMTEEAVWFQTGIHGSLNSLSKNIKRFQKEGVDVFDIVILTYDANRKVLKAFPSTLGELLIKIGIIRNGGGRGLKTVDPVFNLDGKALHERNEKVHGVPKKEDDTSEPVSIEHSVLSGMNDDWIKICDSYPEEGEKIFKYAQLLIDEINKCKEQFDKTAKKSINDEKYDDAHGYIDQSQFLQECLDTITDLFEA
ncbi:hypothetical protein [Butyrivibrio sp. AE3009]|uniref:hypothetical protein n=1 Tax=Butyrivibrio sp. AE3009 TaxID=1280666 RepID=UPI0003B3F6A6|nr:hypothetical protein [Butyrivibrio sp. AE3009]